MQVGGGWPPSPSRGGWGLRIAPGVAVGAEPPLGRWGRSRGRSTRSPPRMPPGGGRQSRCRHRNAGEGKDRVARHKREPSLKGSRRLPGSGSRGRGPRPTPPGAGPGQPGRRGEPPAAHARLPTHPAPLSAPLHGRRWQESSAPGDHTQGGRRGPHLPPSSPAPPRPARHMELRAGERAGSRGSCRRFIAARSRPALASRGQTPPKGWTLREGGKKKWSSADVSPHPCHFLLKPRPSRQQLGAGREARAGPGALPPSRPCRAGGPAAGPQVAPGPVASPGQRAPIVIRCRSPLAGVRAAGVGAGATLRAPGPGREAPRTRHVR